MTIGQAIDRADRLRPNAFTMQDKITWLSQLDHQVFEEVLMIAEENWTYPTITTTTTDSNGNEVTEEKIDKTTRVPTIEFTPYTLQTPLDTQMLIDDLYADAYINWLISRYDLYNRETASYNNSAMVFNNIYSTYMAWYIRTHKPLYKGVRGI